MENGNGHGKVTEHENLTKSHGILLPVMEIINFVSNLYQIRFFSTTLSLSINLGSLHFPRLSENAKSISE